MCFTKALRIWTKEKEHNNFTFFDRKKYCCYAFMPEKKLLLFCSNIFVVFLWVCGKFMSFLLQSLLSYFSAGQQKERNNPKETMSKKKRFLAFFLKVTISSFLQKKAPLLKEYIFPKAFLLSLFLLFVARDESTKILA